MSNKKRGFWFYASRILIAIAALFLLPFLVVYLAVPTYQFEEPKPFYGQYLYNPYQDINPEMWQKCNFHCHTRRYFGITDGRKSKEHIIDSIYSALGYDHAGISDYMSINAHNSDKEDYIPAYEHGYGFFRKTHQLCLGAEKVCRLDYPFMQSLEMKQHLLNKLSKTTRFAIPVHASFTTGYKEKEMMYLSNYRLLEIVNPYGNAIKHWDMALSNGHRVYAIGDDDTHDINNPHEVCLNLTVINAEHNADSILNAMDKGKSYVVRLDNFFFHNNTIEEKAQVIEKLPYLTMARLTGDTLTITTSAKRIDTVRFIGQNGKVLDMQAKTDTARYVISPEDTYVRTELTFNYGRHLYLNPVTRHATPQPVDRRLDSINTVRTLMTRFVLITAVIALIYYLIKKGKEKKDPTQNENSQE